MIPAYFSKATVTEENLVIDGNAFDVLANLIDNSGTISAENGREMIRKIQAMLSELGVNGIDSGSVKTNSYLVWIRNVGGFVIRVC